VYVESRKWYTRFTQHIDISFERTQTFLNHKYIWMINWEFKKNIIIQNTEKKLGVQIRVQ